MAVLRLTQWLQALQISHTTYLSPQTRHVFQWTVTMMGRSARMVTEESLEMDADTPDSSPHRFIAPDEARDRVGSDVSASLQVPIMNEAMHSDPFDCRCESECCCPEYSVEEIEAHKILEELQKDPNNEALQAKFRAAIDDIDWEVDQADAFFDSNVLLTCGVP